MTIEVVTGETKREEERRGKVEVVKEMVQSQ